MPKRYVYLSAVHRWVSLGQYVAAVKRAKAEPETEFQSRADHLGADHGRRRGAPVSAPAFTTGSTKACPPSSGESRVDVRQRRPVRAPRPSAKRSQPRGETLMLLMTKEQREALLKNGAADCRRDRGRHRRHRRTTGPVIKLFTPDGSGTWLLSEIDPEAETRAFGLCDLGFGCPELGWVCMEEVAAARGPLGLPIERDLYFTADKVHRRLCGSGAASGEDQRMRISRELDPRADSGPGRVVDDGRRLSRRVPRLR